MVSERWGCRQCDRNNEPTFHSHPAWLVWECMHVNTMTLSGRTKPLPKSPKTNKKKKGLPAPPMSAKKKKNKLCVAAGLQNRNQIKQQPSGAPNNIPSPVPPLNIKILAANERHGLLQQNLPAPGFYSDVELDPAVVVRRGARETSTTRGGRKR